MAEKSLETVLQQIRQAVGAPGVEELADQQLLQRFTLQQEEAAFSAVVRRHGPMVFGVCRRVLRDSHQAEDAFQATFLVLARKAGSIRKQESLASWLYGVAYRIAGKARARAIRRSALERRAMGMRQAEEHDPLKRPELEEALDQELHKLPEKYRAPLVLCYLEGKTNEEAAQQLGCTTGTVRGRLFRGRDLLRGRLVRRGLGMTSGVALTAMMAEAAQAAQTALPPALLETTIRAGMLYAKGQTAAAISGTAAAMAEGAMRGMFWDQLKTPVAAAAMTGLAGLAMFVGYSAMNDRPPLEPLPAPGGTETRDAGPATAVNVVEIDVLKELGVRRGVGLVEIFEKSINPLRAEVTIQKGQGVPAAGQEVLFRWRTGEQALRTNGSGVVLFALNRATIENLRLVMPRELTATCELVGEGGERISLFGPANPSEHPVNGVPAGFEGLRSQRVEILYPRGRQPMGQQALYDLVSMKTLASELAGLDLVTPCRLVILPAGQPAPNSEMGLQLMVPQGDFEAALSKSSSRPAESAHWLLLHRWAQASLTTDPVLIQDAEALSAKSALAEVLAHEYCRRNYPHVASLRLQAYQTQLNGLLQRGMKSHDLRQNFNEGGGALAFVYWRRAVDQAGPNNLKQLTLKVKEDPHGLLADRKLEMDIAECKAELQRWTDDCERHSR